MTAASYLEGGPRDRRGEQEHIIRKRDKTGSTGRAVSPCSSEYTKTLRSFSLNNSRDRWPKEVSPLKLLSFKQYSFKIQISKFLSKFLIQISFSIFWIILAQERHAEQYRLH